MTIKMTILKEVLGKPLGMRSETRKLYRSYEDSDKIVAYIQDKFGSMVIMKGKKMLFALASINFRFNSWYNCERIDLKVALEILESRNDIIIVDENEYKGIKNNMILNKLKEGN